MIKNTLFIVIFVSFICLFISCGAVQASLVSTMNAYEYPGLVKKDYSVVGIIIIKPIQVTSFSIINDPINLRLMEEAQKMGADDIINVRIDLGANGKWVAATAVAIKYKDGFLDSN